MVDTHLGKLVEAHRLMAQLRNDLDRSRRMPGTDANEACDLGVAAERARRVQEAIMDVVLACHVQLRMPGAATSMDELIKGAGGA